MSRVRRRGWSHGWGLLLAAVLAFVVGTTVGAVSNWVNSLGDVVLGALATALPAWLIYWAYRFYRARLGRDGERFAFAGRDALPGAVLAAALGLAATGDATASLVLVAALVVVVRMRTRRRPPSRSGFPNSRGHQDRGYVDY